MCTNSDSLLAHALRYAQRFPVLPLHGVREDLSCTCSDPDCGRNTAKHPRIPGGLTNASCDPPTVQTWFSRWPDSNVGLRLDRHVVVDVDGDEGLATWQVLVARHGDPGTVSQTTGSGGLHLLFCDADPRRFVSRSRFLPGLDCKAGPGAYMVAPPSRHRSGETYRWNGKGRIALLPSWLEEILPRRDARPTRPSVPPRAVPPGLSSRFGVRALHSELDAVRATPEGRRNHRLFVAAANLGELIAGGELSQVGVEEALVATGLSAGLTPREVRGTVRSGLSRGMETPRRAPERARQ